MFLNVQQKPIERSLLNHQKIYAKNTPRLFGVRVDGIVKLVCRHKVFGTRIFFTALQNDIAFFFHLTDAISLAHFGVVRTTHEVFLGSR